MDGQAGSLGTLGTLGTLGSLGTIGSLGSLGSLGTLGSLTGQRTRDTQALICVIPNTRHKRLHARVAFVQESGIGNPR